MITVDKASTSLLIIAGGKSSRMGHDKRWLKWNGKSFLECTIEKGIAAGFQEIIICAENMSPELMKLASIYPSINVVFDQVTGFGPLEGLRQGMKVMKNDYGWAVSCDMPFFDFQQADKILHVNEGNTPLGIVPLTEGRWQPLASIYSKKLLPKIEEAVTSGTGRMKTVLLDEEIVKIDCTEFKEIFFNVNNKGEYLMALGRCINMQRNVPIVSVSASCSNTGKTSFIEILIEELASIGLSCGVVKRTHHKPSIDREGKDSQRFTKAGAKSVGVVSPDSYFIFQKTEGYNDLEAVASKMQDVDIVLIESRKHGVFPIVHLWRENGEVNIDENTVAFFTSKLLPDCKINQYNINDRASARCLVKFIAGY